MPKSSNQKQKLLLILQYLRENTDESHVASTADILKFLAMNDIKAERKSIYSDIDTLIDMGYDIVRHKGVDSGYALVSREFELAELKLLVDAVQSSKFISEKKSGILIKKIETLTSRFEGKKLQRQVFVANRVKTDNEAVLYVIDGIHEGISTGHVISFTYNEWNLKKQLVVRNNGNRYKVEPKLLVWDDENYYLVAGDIANGIIKHFRVDKMSDIKIEPVSRDRHWENFDVAQYSKEHFAMFHGDKETVTVRFKKHLIGVVIDRFGKDVFIVPKGDDYFDARLNVQVSNQFFGWITGFAGDACIISPQTVIDRYKKIIEDISSKL